MNDIKKQFFEELQSLEILKNLTGKPINKERNEKLLNFINLTNTQNIENKENFIKYITLLVECLEMIELDTQYGGHRQHKF